MTRLHQWLCPVAALFCFALITAGMVRHASASQEADRSERQLDALTAQARELQRLRSDDASSLLGEPLIDDVQRKVHATLEAVNLPSSTATGLRLLPDRAVAPRTDDPRMQRSYVLELGGIEPARLGLFLARWAETQPRWIPNMIQLSVRQRRRDDSLPITYDVTINLTTTYVPAPGRDQEEPIGTPDA